MKTCFLSGLEIPKGQNSKEHVVPKSKAPSYVVTQAYNIRPAIKIINNIKADMFLCEWEDNKVRLCLNALYNYNLKSSDRNIIISALNKFSAEKEPSNPCQHCLLSEQAKEYCCDKERMEEYNRLRMMNNIQHRVLEKQK